MVNDKDFIAFLQQRKLSKKKKKAILNEIENTVFKKELRKAKIERIIRENALPLSEKN
jgi:hypothetical protein